MSTHDVFCWVGFSGKGIYAQKNQPAGWFSRLYGNLIFCRFEATSKILFNIVINFFQTNLEQIDHSFLLGFWQLIKQVEQFPMLRRKPLLSRFGSKDKFCRGILNALASAIASSIPIALLADS
jgi:hypothetical protein